jgi:hypothetical protein
MTFQLADLATPITPEEASALADIVNPFPHLVFRTIGKRGAICHYASGEAVQFLTRRDPVHVRWVAMGWNCHFAELAERGRAR